MMLETNREAERPLDDDIVLTITPAGSVMY